MFNPYVKAILAAAIAFATALASGYDDSVLTTSEIAIAIGAGLTALAVVWGTPIGKAIFGALIAAAGALATALQDDMISAQEWTTIIVAALTALGAVMLIKNTEASNAPNNPRM